MEDANNRSTSSTARGRNRWRQKGDTSSSISVLPTTAFLTVFLLVFWQVSNSVEVSKILLLGAEEVSTVVAATALSNDTFAETPFPSRIKEKPREVLSSYNLQRPRQEGNTTDSLLLKATKKPVASQDISNSTSGIQAVPFLPSTNFLQNTTKSDTTKTDASSQHLFEKSTTMPKWMKDYFQWHRRMRQEIDELATENHYNSSQISPIILQRNQKYFEQVNLTLPMTLQQSLPKHPIQFLILRCNVKDRCGGFADRIKPLPVFVAAAAKSHRILLIRWQRPAALQEFLIPNELNWTSPTWLEEVIFQRRRLRNNLTVDFFQSGAKLQRYLDPDNQPRTMVLEGKIQDANGGEGIYNSMVLGERDNTAATSGINQPGQEPYFDFSSDSSTARYNPIYHDVFHAMFLPSPPVTKIIDSALRQMNLIPGRYAAAHHRAGLEVKRARNKHKHEPAALQSAGINAVNCASHLLRPDEPIYFATDSQVSMQAVREYALEHNRSIVTFEQPLHEDGNPPPNLHIEKAQDWKDRPPSDFYPTFVDFLVMGSGRCMSYGGGGFGKFASMLSYNSSCIIDHSRKNTICDWKSSI